MSQFRKKPVVIEAKQASGTPESNREIIDWTRGSATPAFLDDHPDHDGLRLNINTLEGAMWVTPGDWIIKGVKGEFYPCKPDIFAATYEPSPAAPDAGLLPHQQRVVAEKADLDERAVKLHAFILDNPTFLTLPIQERHRLELQAELMGKLSEVLSQRIADFGATVQDSLKVETKTYADGTTATGVAPLPEQSPLEQEIQAKASSAPRVTPADIEAEIVSEHYFTAREGVLGELASDGVPPSIYEKANAAPQSLGLLTFAVLVLRNGFTVTGESACASPENFNAEIGRRIARENAIEKMWPLLGFRLKDNLHALASGPT